MRTYAVTLTGKTPLLMHNDDVEWADRMEAWKNEARNKATSKAGDDRSPAWRWLGALYHDGDRFVMPSDNLMRCLMEAGAMMPTGKGQKTFKSQTQSGCMTGEMYWPFLVHGKEVPVKPFFDGMETRPFDGFQSLAAEHRFRLLVKRAKIAQSKHIRVRPQFDTWETSGTIVVTDDQITEKILLEILTLAGRYKGLGDWRPGGKTPGAFGMFTAEVRVA